MAKMLLVIGLLSLISQSCSTNVYETQAWQNRHEVWQSFRHAFPYHTQLISIKEFDSDNSCLFILPEPPADVSFAQIKSAAEGYNVNVDTLSYKIGLNGKAKDAVIAAADLSVSDRKRLLIAINWLFYDTNYKSDLVLDLNEKTEPIYFLNDKELNHSISPGELYNWFIDGDEKLVSESNESTSYTLTEALKGTTGCFFSETPGFVALVVSRNDDFSKHKASIRKFVLDSDIILGCIGNDDNIALIGRERELSLNEYSPLLVETILLLAANSAKDELAQSFERNAPFAGPLEDGNDWAPIYLSPELINTEFGSLLNMTDQMLKSWSSNGLVTYDGWDHPHPTYWGFGQSERGVIDEIETGSLTFNWNTEDCNVLWEVDDLEIIGVTTTGSLPMSYIPESAYGSDMDSSSRIKLDYRGHDFFSNLNSPLLSRAQQYAFLYDIFNHFSITTHSRHAAEQSKILQESLTDIYEEVLDKFEKDYIPNKLANDTSFMFRLYKLNRQFEIDMDLDPIELMELAFEELGTHEMARSLSENWLRSFSEYNSFEDLPYHLEEKFQVASITHIVFEDVRFLLPYVDSVYENELKYRVFEINAGLRPSSGSSWIRTPSALLSDAGDSGSGGHNIRAGRSVKIKASSGVKSGKYINMLDDKHRTVMSLSNKDMRALSGDDLLRLKRNPADSRPRDLNTQYSARTAGEIVARGSRKRGAHSIHIEPNTQGELTLDGKTIVSYEDLLKAIEKIKDQGKNIEVRVKKLSNDEMKAIVKTLEFKHTGKIKAKGLFSTQKFNFEFSQVKLEKMGNDLVVQIPISYHNRFQRIQIILKGLSEEVRELLMRKLEVILRNFSGRQVSPDDIEDAIKRELKEIHGVSSDDIKFDIELNDLQISWNMKFDSTILNLV